jgi:hypothetical protein
MNESKHGGDGLFRRWNFAWASVALALTGPLVAGLLWSWGAQPVAAQEPTVPPSPTSPSSLELAPTSGIPGSSATLRGQSFPGGERVQIFWDGEPLVQGGEPLSPVSVHPDGTFQVVFTVPVDDAGDHVVRATIVGSSAASAQVTFHIDLPTATPTGPFTATPTDVSPPTDAPTGTPFPSPTFTPSPTWTPPPGPTLRPATPVGSAPTTAPTIGWVATATRVSSTPLPTWTPRPQTPVPMVTTAASGPTSAPRLASGELPADQLSPTGIGPYTLIISGGLLLGIAALATRYLRTHPAP